MATPLELQGARSKKETHSAPLFVNRMFTGLWTQRNPLRDAATPYLYEKFYSGSRFDSIIAGNNVELTTRLTLQRRAGTVVYNSGTFAAINSFYEFRTFSGSTETIKIMADLVADVRDVTGPSTNTLLFTKSGGAGQSYFQSVGNILYFGNGVDQKKWNLSAVTNWGIVAPTSAPTVTHFSSGSNGVGFWQPATVFPQPQALLDSNGNIEYVDDNPGSNTSAATYPIWATDQRNALTLDGNINWKNVGPLGGWLANTEFMYQSAILDNNGNIQIAYSVAAPGTTGATIPAFSSTAGVTTVDNNVTWKCAGAGKPSVFRGYGHVYAYRNSSTGHVSTASPASIGTGPVLGSYTATVAGTGSADTQVDKIWIFRTLDGGATYFFLKEIANPGGIAWSTTDNLTDSALNELIEAPIASSNNPPPAGLINLTYHLGRIFGSVGNTVYYSNGPDTTTGSGNESFPPANNFIFPSQVQRMWPMALGLMVFTVSDVYLILGQGTANSPLYSIPFAAGLGLANYNAFTVNGAIAYFLTTDLLLVGFDPGAGISEVGFPIGDQIASLFTTSGSYLTWHSAAGDKGLFLAQQSIWYRMNPTPSPETGVNWSPTAQANFVFKGFQSVETAPGTRQLLIGPGSSGNILTRDPTVFTDTGSTYNVTPSAVIGSIVLGHPGQLAMLEFIAVKTRNANSDLTMELRLNEIGGSFEDLTSPVNDPPQLAAPSSHRSKRWYLSSVVGGVPKPQWAQHLQIGFIWPTDSTATEILSYSLWGTHWQES